MTDLDLIADLVARYEGGTFTNLPHDRGGATRWGVTQRLLSEYLQRPATVDEVERLSFTVAVHVHVWAACTRPHLDRVKDDRLRRALLDYAMHSGPTTAVCALQAAVGVKVDGQLGPITEQATNAAANPEGVRLLTIADRLHHLGHLLRYDSTQQEFAEGWFNRVGSILVT